MLAGMIFQKEPFFHGHDNYDQLVKIAKVGRCCCTMLGLGSGTVHQTRDAAAADTLRAVAAWLPLVAVVACISA